MKKIRKEQIFILCFSLFVFLSGSVVIISENINNARILASYSTDHIYDLESDYGSDGSNTESGDEPLSQGELKKILVHVAGKVMSPGVYELTEGSRVIDAIESAGGAAPEADLDIINLAAFISDGQQIYVPSSEESAGILHNIPVPGNALANNNGKVNINTAGAEELQSLTGIGPGKAWKIIEYRNTYGPFLSPEDLLNVSGIGEKTFEKIKDRITVN
ncbi:MAG: ComEA family DNA-binding protein [Halanaerobiaceae bacterium]|jgi:competence protein ComEA|nr:ComEA family DNA-binding protein [Halanaerobiaceae bacterium]